MPKTFYTFSFSFVSGLVTTYCESLEYKNKTKIIVILIPKCIILCN